MTRYAVALSLALSLISLHASLASETADPAEQSSPLTKVEGASITCKDEYQLYAIDTQKRRIWSSDPGMDEGMELKVQEFKVAKCPNCIDIDAQLMFLGESQDMHFKLRGKSLSVQAKQENGKLEELTQLPCEGLAK